MSETRKNTDKLLQFISEKYEKGHLDNDSLIQLIALAGDYLNLRTIQTYADEHGMSYNGVKKFRKIKTLFGTKYVIDND
jgi:hypothetical protein